MDNSQELKLNYPCDWEYKVILEAHFNVKEIVKSVLDKREHTIRKSQNSKAGKYSSYTVKTLVHSSNERRVIFEALKKHESIKFVL